jgi:hypothetical protein
LGGRLSARKIKSREKSIPTLKETQDQTARILKIDRAGSADTEQERKTKSDIAHIKRGK